MLFSDSEETQSILTHGCDQHGLARGRTCLVIACAIGLAIAVQISSPSPLSAQSVSNNSPPKSELFDRAIVPLFEHHCVECHSSDRHEGGLSLDTFNGFLRGGDSGPIYLPQTPLQSPLLEAVQANATTPAAMPKGRPALKADDVKSLTDWLASGAPWSSQKQLTTKRSIDNLWWSLQPLKPSNPPTNPTDRVGTSAASHQSRSRIDAYIEHAWQAQNLTGSAPAARGELIRRLSFDLTGLPPSIEAVEQFERDDRPDAVERLVDRMLASPAYGERWARHWLDVVHYGETHGYDKDKMRTSAWPYRDYVIQSFNSDKPIRQFAIEQIAGDILWPNSAEALEAVGFLSAGPWDFIGHAEVPETKLDGRIARHLDRDDMVQNTFLTFQSLTVGCAQCHDHKFDPISQKEYYGLQAVFAALDRTDRKYYRDPELQARYAALQSDERRLVSRQSQVQKQIKQLGGSALEALDKRIADNKAPAARRPAEHGYHSAIAARADETKWVQIDLGTEVEITRVEWVACHDDFNGIGAGFGAPPAWRIEAALDTELKQALQLLVENKPESKKAKKPGIQPQTFQVQSVRARFVRFTATELAPRKDDYILALAELRIFNTAGDNVALGKPVTALDSIESPVRWSRSNLVDGKAPTDGASSTQDQQLQAERAELLKQVVPQSLRDDERQLVESLQTVRKRLASLPQPSTVYCATIHYGQGAFAGTGPNGGRPRSVRIHPRGDVSRDGPAAEPMALECLSRASSETLSQSTTHTNSTSALGTTESSDGARRSGLAKWLTHDDNPLFWRSMANRLWAYHFTRGIVDTPNDFGRMGSLPSHPELLDALAIDLREHQSLKQLHRALLLSATYQQSSRATSTDARQMLELDPTNRWLTRSPRRRLEAEAIRDAMLSVAGLLRREMGGPSYQDFVIEHPEHSPHYEYRLHDPQDPATMRRSIYRFIARSQTQPLMTLLDCADPSMQVDVRSQSNSPTQALALLNNSFTLMAAQRWADHVARQYVSRVNTSPVNINTLAAEDSHDLRAVRRRVIAKMFGDAMGRPATDEEIELLIALADASPMKSIESTEQQNELVAAVGRGLDQVARAIFNMNEFVYVD